MQHRTRRAAILVLFVVALGVLSCNDAPTAPRANLSGSWEGFVMRIGAIMEVTLTDSDGAVTGDGHTTGYLSPVPLTVEGTFEAPNFSLTFTSEGFLPFVFEGTATPSRMTGKLNGSGFEHASLVLNKR